ncbi:MAG TPA: trans-aconitate 2-methyltransferase [Streptosporangiaceae bacterium]|nr:trans-aconitate 2-methyltransferase [Streptosporangiaceae bacterium]
MWDPAQYLHFADERSRPFYDLAARIGATAPGYVVDLGCGPGQLTASLAARWPQAEVLGIDSSAEMIAAAQQADYGAAGGGQLSFVVGDVSDWEPARSPDVIISNAVLQWVPKHMELLPRWADYLAPAGWLAFQLPGNFDQPNHAVLRELASSARWREQLAGVELNRQAGDPGQYLDLLARLGLRVDAWETTYLHVLQGPDPVTDWYKGTGLRPVLAALDPAHAQEFLAEYSRQVQKHYPAAPYGTVLPFRRVFVVAQRG